jgi:hypothetical protein
MEFDTFTLVADRVSELSQLDRLESRGTLRIALKRAGVDANHLGLDEVAATFSTIMPEELEARGCTDAAAICNAIIQSLEGVAPESATRSRDEIMRRLGGA